MLAGLGYTVLTCRLGMYHNATLHLSISALFESLTIGHICVHNLK